MAVHFLNGTDFKNHTPAAPKKFQKAVEAAKTYEWVEVEEVTKTGEDSEAPPEWPKKYECKKTGVVALKKTENDPVMFVDDKLLILTADEQDVKDIIL